MLRWTTKQVADVLGTQEWRVRRLFETGDLLETERFAGSRMIDGSQVLSIVELLAERKWIPAQPEERFIQNAVAAIAAGNGREARRQLQKLRDLTNAHLTLGSDIKGEVQDA